MRNVAPIALDGVEPRDLSGEPGPDFDVVDPRELVVDDEYQRNPSPRTLALVRRIVAGWSWAKFKPPVVVRVGGALHVLDGQHTAIAAASHGGIGAIPVIVVAAPAVSDRAAAFVSHAVDRVQASPLQVHRAAVVAGDPAALAVEAVCRGAGVALLHSAPDAGRYRPRDTVALAGVRGLLARRGADRAREVLAALAAADLAPITGDHVMAADALLCDDAYAEDFDAARVTAAFRGLTPAVLAEARELAVAKQLPQWRALTAALCRRAPRRPRAKAAPGARPSPPAPDPDPEPAPATEPAPTAVGKRPGVPYQPTGFSISGTERAANRYNAPAGARTFDGLGRVVMPSAELAVIVGAGPVLRSDAVEAVAKYVRSRDLYDAVDRRVVVADAKLRAVFGRDRFPASDLSAIPMPHARPVAEDLSRKAPRVAEVGV